MARIKIIINTDNAAFGESPGDRACEVVRILEKQANIIREEDRIIGMPILDINGNRVGFINYEK